MVKEGKRPPLSWRRGKKARMKGAGGKGTFIRNNWAAEDREGEEDQEVGFISSEKNSSKTTEEKNRRLKKAASYREKYIDEIPSLERGGKTLQTRSQEETHRRH